MKTMILLRLIFISFTFVAVSSAQTNEYVLSDSLEFSDMISGGTAKVLKVNNRLIDTICTFFGVQSIGKSTIVYQKVEIRGKSEYGDSYEGNFSDYIVYKQGKKSLLRKSLSFFDDWFSSPSIINGRIYYWGLKHQNNSDSLSIYAMRYNFLNGKTESLILFTDLLETDNPGFFYPPILDKRGYRFQFEYKGWIVNDLFTQKNLIK
jgi:hypothetical protein